MCFKMSLNEFIALDDGIFPQSLVKKLAFI